MTGPDTRRPALGLWFGAWLGVFLSADIASACPVCFAAKNEANRAAFIDMTVLMTALPLVMLGAAAWWFLKRTRDVEGDDDRDHARKSLERVSKLG